MADASSPNQRRYPNVVGAGILAGVLAGLAVGGTTDEFGLWVPLLTGVGLVVGLLMTWYGGDRNVP